MLALLALLALLSFCRILFRHYPTRPSLCVCGYEHKHESPNAPNDVAFHVKHVRLWASWQQIAKGLNTAHESFRNNQLRDKFMNPKPSNYLGVAEKYPHNWL